MVCEHRHAAPTRAICEPVAGGWVSVRSAKDPPQLQLNDEFVFNQVAHCGPHNLRTRAASDYRVGISDQGSEVRQPEQSGQGISGHGSMLVQCR